MSTSQLLADGQNITDLLGLHYGEFKSLIEASGGSCKTVAGNRVTTAKKSYEPNSFTFIRPNSVMRYPWPSVQCKVFSWKVYAPYDQGKSDKILLIDIEYNGDREQLRLLHKDYLQAKRSPRYLKVDEDDYEMAIQQYRWEDLSGISYGCSRLYGWEFQNTYYDNTGDFRCVWMEKIEGDVYTVKRVFVKKKLFSKTSLAGGSLSVGFASVVKGEKARVRKLVEEEEMRQKEFMDDRLKKRQSLKDILGAD